MYWLHKFNFGRIIEFFKNPKTFNNSNTKNKMEIIRPGHYRNKFTSSSSDTQDIIRVLGESEIPGVWILFEKLNETTHKTISEYELQNSWELLNTSITEESTAPKKHLLDGLDFIDEENESIGNQTKIIHIPIEQLPSHSASLIPNVEIPVVKILQPQTNPEDIFILSILEKISISKNNERFDTNDKPDYIKIEIDVPIDYKFDKLKETVNLLDLNKYLVTNLLTSNSELKDLLQDKLKSKILELFKDTTIIEKPVNIVEPVVVEKEIIKEESVIEIKQETEKIEIANNKIEKIVSENDERLLAFQNKISDLYSNNPNN